MSRNKRQQRSMQIPQEPHKATAWALGTLAVVLTLAATWGLARRPEPADPPVPPPAPAVATPGREEIEGWIEANRTLQLAPEQEAVRVAALSALPAPCCAKFSAATCCCECNLARATWGLAKELIVEQDRGVEAVRSAVADWHRAINPGGFSGEACFTGGCGRAFRHDGCGGMEADRLLF